MAAKSGIEWTDATWTPIRARVKRDAAGIARAKGYTSLVQIAEKMAGHVGPHCEHASPECDRCYSEAGNGRCLPSNGTGLPFDRRSRDLIEPIVDEKILEQPLHWRRGRRIFVCSQTDLFGEWVPDEYIDRVFAVMALCPQHTFQVLTKRPRRMREYFAKRPRSFSEGNLQRTMPGYICRPLLASLYGTSLANLSWRDGEWPLSNVWLGVTAGDQQRADERIPDLLATPAAKRFVSVEPMLGPVDLTDLTIDMSPVTERLVAWHKSRGEELTPEQIANYPPYAWMDSLTGSNPGGDDIPHLDWVICGGESGHGARPMHPDWARSLRDQCQAAGVPFFFKQWGEYGTTYYRNGYAPVSDPEPRSAYPWGDKEYSPRLGKTKAGRLLDGQEWSQFPEARHAE